MLNYYEYADLVKIKEKQDELLLAATAKLSTDRPSSRRDVQRHSARLSAHGVPSLSPIPETRREARYESTYHRTLSGDKSTAGHPEDRREITEGVRNGELPPETAGRPSSSASIVNGSVGGAVKGNSSCRHCQEHSDRERTPEGQSKGPNSTSKRDETPTIENKVHSGKSNIARPENRVRASSGHRYTISTVTRSRLHSRDGTLEPNTNRNRVSYANKDRNPSADLSKVPSVRTNDDASTIGNRNSGSSAVNEEGLQASTQVVTFPVPNDIDPVMLEVCIKVIRPNSSETAQRERGSHLNGGGSNGVDGRDTTQSRDQRERSLTSRTSVERPETSSSLGSESLSSHLCEDPVINQGDAGHQYRALNQDVTASNRMSSGKEAIVATERSQGELGNATYPTQPKREAGARANPLYKIPRPAAPSPAEREQTYRSERKGDVQLHLTTPKYTQYALEYQDRKNFRNRGIVVKDISLESSDSGNKINHGAERGNLQNPTAFDDVYERGPNEGKDLMVHNKTVIRNPGNYRSATALRIRIPMESDHFNTGEAMKHTRSMEDITDKEKGSQLQKKTGSTEALFKVGKEKKQNIPSPGPMVRYASDPAVSGRKVPDEYIDTYQLEMEVMRRRTNATPVARPKTPAITDEKTEKAQVEAERRRRQRLLHSAIKGWGSTTVVLRPKTGKKQVEYTPLMIKSMNKSPLLKVKGERERSQPVLVKQAGKPPELGQQGQSQDRSIDQNAEKPDVCKLKIRFQRKSRPKTCIARETVDPGNNIVPARPKTATHHQTPVPIPAYSDQQPYEQVAVQPIPTHARSAMARTFREQGYNRPRTGGFQRAGSVKEAPTVLDRLVILGNHMRTETPTEDGIYPAVYGPGRHVSYTRESGYSQC